MNRRSFLAKLVGCVVAAAISIRLTQPEPEFEYTEYHFVGVETGRWSSAEPNFVELRKEQHRKLFVEDPEHVYIVDLESFSL